MSKDEFKTKNTTISIPSVIPVTDTTSIGGIYSTTKVTHIPSGESIGSNTMGLGVNYQINPSTTVSGSAFRQGNSSNPFGGKPTNHGFGFGLNFKF